MRPDYVTISIAVVLSFLLVGASAYTKYKSHNEDKTKAHNSVTEDKDHFHFSRWSTYSRLYHYLLKREKPWLLLTNSDQCFQEPCTKNKDCCRGYNICDQSAKICRDCWYGHHCRSAANCCERFPICKKDPKETWGKCSMKFD